MRLQLRHTILASLLAAVWIVVPVLAALHVAVEAHEYCADHGVLEEGHGHHDLGAAMASETSEGSVDELRPGSAPASDDDGHTSCAFGEQATHDTVPFVVTLIVEPAPAIQSPPVVFGALGLASSIEILRGAPKTSPPLVG